MSTQPVSNSLFQELQSFVQNRAADIKQLGSALQSGDLQGAQQVYNALVALGQNGPFSNSGAFASPDRARTFEALGQAIQSGDLAGAQAAFAKLQQAPGQVHRGDSLNPAYVVTITSTQSQPVAQSKSEFWHQRKLDLDQLGSALQSGDTAAAQKAYDALVALGQNGPLKNGATFHRTDRAQDFAAIGAALQSGDLAAAQQAFTDLENTFNHSPALLGPPTPAPVPPTPPPTPAPVPTVQPPQKTLPPEPIVPLNPPASVGGGPSTPPEIIINLGGTPSTSGSAGDIVINLAQPTSTPEEVQINLGDNSGSSGQITINASQQNGKEEVSINLSGSTAGYQLVLNLLESNTSTTAAGSSVSLQA